MGRHRRYLSLAEDDGGGDRLAYQVLRGKRDALLHRLGELRSRLIGQGGDPVDTRRGGWR